MLIVSEYEFSTFYVLGGIQGVAKSIISKGLRVRNESTVNVFQEFNEIINFHTRSPRLVYHSRAFVMKNLKSS